MNPGCSLLTIARVRKEQLKICLRWASVRTKSRNSNWQRLGGNKYCCLSKPMNFNYLLSLLSKQSILSMILWASHCELFPVMLFWYSHLQIKPSCSSIGLSFVGSPHIGCKSIELDAILSFSLTLLGKAGQAKLKIAYNNILSYSPIN